MIRFYVSLDIIVAYGREVKSMKKRIRIIAAVAIIIVAALGIQALACTPEWEFSGFYRERCEPNACGLFWAKPQKYLIEIYQSDCADENGEYTREGETIYAGFGNCC